MDGLLIGLDLCDDYGQVSVYGRDNVWTIPGVICRAKKQDQWYIGDEAYSVNLSGEGVMIEKPASFVRKDKLAEADGESFDGARLMEEYLNGILNLIKKECETDKVIQMVVALPHMDSKVMDCLLYCADFLGIPRSRFHVISREESFLYYVLSQKKEIWAGQVGLFDFSQRGLRYFEMKVQRGLKQTTVLSDSEELEEGINLDMLESTSGARLADKALCSCSERLLAKKMFSSILLTGKGFEKPFWASDFMKVIGKRRKIYSETGLFARGAARKAADCQEAETAFPYVMICEGRLKYTISMEVIHDEKPTQLVIAASGDSWYEAKSTLDFILDNQEKLVFQIQPLDSRKKYDVTMKLEGLPKRPNRTTRIQMKVGFRDENTMAVVVADRGFGELFPASDIVIRREIAL